MGGCYVRKTDATKQAINDKLKVLEDFYIVDTDNRDAIRNQLIVAIRENPGKDVDAVLDQVAMQMIRKKLEG